MHYSETAQTERHERVTEMGSRRTWPLRDERAAALTDIRILQSRGLTLREATTRLGLPLSTAYRWGARER